ncbi:ketopantoate reductase family protein [Spirosoma koreense]
MSDHIYIVGAGAIGKALAVFLTLNQKRVTLLRGSLLDGSAYPTSIRVILHTDDEREATITIGTLADVPELDGPVVLTNKSYGNETLAQVLAEKTKTAPIVILQNGLGVEQPFLNLGFSQVYRCVLFVTSQLIAENRIRFKPVAVSPIGIIDGNKATLDALVGQLTTPDFSFKADDAIQAVIWKKTIINSVFNSICPLLDIDNGIFHRDEKALTIARRIIDECVQIATAAGIALTEKDVEESLLQISRASDGQLISTLQDINNRRPTELDTLNFAIVRQAETLNRASVVRETRLLGELTKLKSDLNR